MDGFISYLGTKNLQIISVEKRVFHRTVLHGSLTWSFSRGREYECPVYNRHPQLASNSRCLMC
jgi:hypothetical protein